MPCIVTADERAYYAEQDRLKAEQDKTKVAEAALCALFKAYGEVAVLGSINYEAAGITKADLQKWWLKHQLEDLEK